MPVDLRSDTVTRPTPGMLAAMAGAPLGDDVLGDDPTVNALETRCAQLSGKESAVFVPSGTMANLVAIAIHTRPGDEVLMHEGAHPFNYESAGAAAIAGVQTRVLSGPAGVPSPDELLRSLRPDDVHAPRSRLLCLEDTHNRGGGKVQPLENTDALCATAREHGLATHLDGARVWNAVVQSGVSLPRRARDFDTVSFCFSKGLGCPAGSILCGSDELVREARRWRKRLGGGMRQAGVLAGAAMYALDHHVERLAHDHAHARQVTEELLALGLQVERPETNIVLVDVPRAQEFAGRLREQGVWCFAIAPERLRLVFHLDVHEASLPAVVDAFRRSRS